MVKPAPEKKMSCSESCRTLDPPVPWREQVPLVQRSASIHQLTDFPTGDGGNLKARFLRRDLLWNGHHFFNNLWIFPPTFLVRV
ncbi:hypothetical protein AVEN_106916-1, partial [Araneus ventricosus]